MTTAKTKRIKAGPLVRLNNGRFICRACQMLHINRPCPLGEDCWNMRTVAERQAAWLKKQIE